MSIFEGALTALPNIYKIDFICKIPRGTSYIIITDSSDGKSTCHTLENGESWNIEPKPPVQLCILNKNLYYNARQEYYIEIYKEKPNDIRVLTLGDRVSLLEKMVEEIYYAPGMPGYIKARESFDKTLIQME